MPEGHTIHRAARDQRPMLAGKRLDVSSPQGRFAEGAAQLDGRVCASLEAYGKHLLYAFADDATLHIHLGLFGRFRAAKVPAAEPRGAVRVRMRSATHVVDINGPNTCVVLDPAEVAALLARLGPDPLRADADPDRAFDRIARSRVAVGQLLMDQSVIAGIGNIYRTEILWRQRIHPRTPGKAIDRAAFDALWRDTVHLLEIGVKRGAIVTADGAGRRGRLNIFAKASCPRCGEPVVKSEMATRRLFTCESCQPRVDAG